MPPDDHRLADPDSVPSPGLLFYPARIDANNRAMLAIAGSPERLRPHAKTHKTAEIIARQVALGITRHKVATLAEAETVARAGAAEVLVAYPLVGPNPRLLAELAVAFPRVTFQAVVDHPAQVPPLAAATEQAGVILEVLVDLDVGMGRTGVALTDATTLYELVSRQRSLGAAGLHAYYGQIARGDAQERKRLVDQALDAVVGLRAGLERRGLTVSRVVAGGTPSFPATAARRDIPGLECSPGTLSLSDQNTRDLYPDLAAFEPAALLFTRVVSRPGPRRATLDLGHKAVAAEQPLAQRVRLLGVPEYTVAFQSEEHLVIDFTADCPLAVGDPVYGVPAHVCPTVALHAEALTVESGQVTGRWPIAARQRKVGVV